MNNIKICYKNILEKAQITILTGDEDPNYPLYRIYDRDIGRYFRTNSPTNLKLKLVFSDNILIDRIIIPSGHTLNGTTITIKYIENDIENNILTFSQSDSNIIDRSFTPINKSQYIIEITNATDKISFTELFLTETYTFERNPVLPFGFLDKVYNVRNEIDIYGRDRFYEYGPPKERREYTLYNVNYSQVMKILELLNETGMKKPFFLYDHNSQIIYGKLIEEPNIKQTAYDRYSLTLKFLEVLP